MNNEMKRKQTMNFVTTVLWRIVCLFFVLIFVKVGYLVATEKVSGKSVSKHTAAPYTKDIVISSKRGSILDRNGTVIAEDVESYKLYAVISSRSDVGPTLSEKEFSEVATKLAPILNMKQEEIREIFESGKEKDSFQVYFGKNGNDVSYETRKKIEALKIDALKFERAQKRYYPNATFASHAIGYTALVDEQQVGQLGLELLYDEQLKNENGIIHQKSDVRGNGLPFSNSNLTPPKYGDDLYSTIDSKIQTFLEEAINDAVKKYDPEEIVGIVMDPKTGAVLAMSTRPTYDPNIRDISNFYNDAISKPVEPGSTMKIFTLASAIDSGNYNGNATFKSGRLKVGNSSIGDHNWGKGWGTITFDEGIARSSNVGVSKLVQDYMGFDLFLDYLKKFRFDQKTGIDLPGENQGEILFNYDIEKITTTFGQGTTVTPIQLITAATAIANEGQMMQPYMIDRIVANDGTVKSKTQPKVIAEPVSKESAQKTKEILRLSLTEEYGTALPYNIEGYEVTGKSGTAQIPNPKGKGYLTGRENFLFSFIGMAPMDNPELLIYVTVKQPKLKVTEVGSAPVSDIFNSVMFNSLQYLGVKANFEKKDKRPTEELNKMPNVTNQSIAAAKMALTKVEKSVVVIGNGTKVIDQFPKNGATIVPKEKIILITDKSPKMPNLIGWTLRDVMNLAEIFNINVQTIGNGVVIEQSIPHGRHISKDDYLVINLADKVPKKKPATETETAEEKESSPMD
ncbi:MAG: penicillin-binding protein [Bacilli bacterium]